MTMLLKEQVSTIKEELLQSEELMRTIPFRADQRLSDDERRLLWNAVQHGQMLLNALLPMQADLVKALELLDIAGIWTGMDNVLADRVQAVLDDYCSQYRKKARMGLFCRAAAWVRGGKAINFVHGIATVYRITRALSITTRLENVCNARLRSQTQHENPH